MTALQETEAKKAGTCQATYWQTYHQLCGRTDLTRPMTLGSLTAFVVQLQQEVGELRQENAGLRRQVSELRCEVGYWKSQHARAVERNTKLQAELDLANAEIRNLKAERFGKSTEKQSATDLMENRVTANLTVCY